MSEADDRHRRAGTPEGLTTPGRFTRKALASSPTLARAFLWPLLVRYWRVVLVLVGFLVQVVLTVLMWQLVDLTISLMEVWAELARKHLELVLS